MPDLQPRLAVLIDADNVSATHLGPLMEEIATLGVASVRRMYGDWTTPQLGAWKDAANQHAVQPIQQFAYTKGKNSTDSALIIDAMDLLYTDRFDGFCLVSSDSDFTRLASRLRESGMTVYGFGQRKTPEPFIRACDRFTYFEVLGASEDELPVADGPKAAPAKRAQASKQTPAAKLRSDNKLVNLLRKGIEGASDDDGWAHLGGIGSQIRNQAPDFDSRNWGYAKLGDLVTAIGLFEIKTAGNNQKVVRLKQK